MRRCEQGRALPQLLVRRCSRRSDIVIFVHLSCTYAPAPVCPYLLFSRACLLKEISSQNNDKLAASSLYSPSICLSSKNHDVVGYYWLLRIGTSTPIFSSKNFWNLWLGPLAWCTAVVQSITFLNRRNDYVGVLAVVSNPAQRRVVMRTVSTVSPAARWFLHHVLLPGLISLLLHVGHHGCSKHDDVTPVVYSHHYGMYGL